MKNNLTRRDFIKYSSIASVGMASGATSLVSYNKKDNSMKNILLINGSPRKSGNTATLLQKAKEGAISTGATAEMVHLVDYQFKGCISCFSCKRKDTKLVGECALKDELTPVLEKGMKADALVLGSPIYIGDVTGMIRNFIERFVFMNIYYNQTRINKLACPKNFAFFYTMNIGEEQSKIYKPIYEHNINTLKRFKGYVTDLICADTYQFDNYDLYDAQMFDEQSKAKRKREIFPKECEKAYQIGIDLVSK